MYLKSFKNRIVALMIPLILASCHVMLIGAYDQVTDESIQQIQTEVSILLVKVEKNIADGTLEKNKYENLKDDYDNIEGQIKSLKIRVNSLPKYKIISEQIDLLEANIIDLEKFNKIGFTDIKPVHAMTALQNGLKRQKNS
jgi:hypothetical protein